MTICLVVSTTITMINFANEPTAMVHPKMTVQVGGAALSGVGSAADDDSATNATLRAQRIIHAQVKVRPDRAGIGHRAQTARVRAHPAGRRRRLRQTLLQVTVVLHVHLLFHFDFLQFARHVTSRAHLRSQ